MKKTLTLLVVLFFFSILVGCSPNPGTPSVEMDALVTVTASSVSTIAVTPTPVPTSPTHTAIHPTQITSIPTPHAEDKSSLPNYDIQAVLDYENGILAISQTISITNQTSQDFSYLPFYAEPNRYTGSLSINRIQVNGNTQQDYSLNSNILLIPLQPVLFKPLDPITVFVNYSIQLPQMNSDQGNGIFGRTIYQTNLLDWYFWLPPYSEDAGWIVHTPAGFGEHTAYPLANFDITLSIVNPPDDLVVTGSTSPVITSENTYHFNHSASRNVYISMSPYFVHTHYQDANLIVNSYSFTGHEPAAELVLDSTVKAVKIYGNTISPYRHPVLNIVETNFVDGLESDGMYFLGSTFFNNLSTTRSILTILAVHETAHQWWYAGVANDQALEPWLDESFATFMESVYFQNLSESDYNWWENYRFSVPQSPYPVNSPLYNFASFRPYRDAVYLGGARFLIDLQSEMGDGLFLTFIKDYYNQASHQSVINSDFFFETLTNYFDILHSSLYEDYFTP